MSCYIQSIVISIDIKYIVYQGCRKHKFIYKTNCPLHHRILVSSVSEEPPHHHTWMIHFYDYTHTVQT